jgi:type I restriction enzyme S subunit
MNTSTPNRIETTLGVAIQPDGTIKTGPFGTTLKASEYAARGVPVISVGEIGRGRLVVHPKTPRVPTSVVARLPDYVLREGDIVFARKGSVERSARVSQHEDGWFLGSDGIRVRVGSNIDSSFLAYQLRSRGTQAWVLQHASGTTMASLNQGTIERIPLTIPPLPEQRAIARILGALDDKIELNRRTNETLEGMARALFQSWFVDFDPVRAKMEGRQPEGMDAETAKLFPNGLADSELGRIPSGWSCRPLEAWCSALSGGTPSKAAPALWNGDIPWVSPKSLNSIHADEAEDLVTEAAIGNGTRLAPRGSTLIMVRGMGLHQKVRIGQAVTDVAFNQDVKALVANGIDESLLLFALLHAQAELLTKVETSGHGTGKLASEILFAHRIVAPPASVQDRLARPFSTSSTRIATARQESRTLTALRDTLLPKLLSGELRVPDAERAVSKVL